MKSAMYGRATAASAHEVLGETCKNNTTTSQSFEELCDQMSYREMERLCSDAQVICPEGDAEQDIQEYVLPWARVILGVLAEKEEHDAIVQSEVLATKLVQRLAPSARVNSTKASRSTATRELSASRIWA